MSSAARRIERYLPGPLRQALRQISGRRAWQLPSPMQGMRLAGPGVYGTYVARRHEREVVQTLVDLVQPGWSCIDIGAHYGYFSLLLAQLSGPSGRVAAFEASPENASILRHNLELNGMARRISVHNYAVSDGAEALASLTLPEAFTLEWTLQRRPGVRSIQVPAISLDRHFDPGTQIDLIKMDIEGAEALAVAGMRRLLAESRPLLLVELHGEAGRRAAEELWRLGYRLQDLEHGGVYTAATPFEAQPGHVVGRGPR